MKLILEFGREINLPRRMGWLDGLTDAMAMKLGELREMVAGTGRPGVLQPMGLWRIRDD